MRGAAKVRAGGWRRARAVSLCTALLLTAAGCSGPNLEPVAPAGFDLTGTWQLVPELSDPAPRSQDVAMSFAAQDFPVLKAFSMAIEQNRGSMGVSYNTGDYRDVTWGQRQRGLWKVDAGWSDGNLHIISAAHDAKATEIMRLEDGGKLLVVEVALKAQADVKITRVFERGS